MQTLVGKKAPKFLATAVTNGCNIVPGFSLEQFFGKKYVVLFFYPKDFTFVCPTEIWAFQEKIQEFEKRNVALIGCSTDSEFSHFAWLETPREQGGIQGVTFPIVSDINKTIADEYGVLAGYEDGDDGTTKVTGELIAYRGLFLIDKSGIVQHCVINNMPLGRSVDEALRMVDALQHFEKFGEVCPANWRSGQKSMKPNRDGLKEFFG
ncbi:MAG: peroxiredoxin [Puniceicoccales bacterium]|jgi:peroxiredoxin (alkyl hydroperoxide reductase subunit C)|nr:peroxiredoxin [Puniceicoccales bacterium]